MITCCAKPIPRTPRRTPVHRSDIKIAIQHAQDLCFNYEKTIECRIAWEKVEELSSEYDKSMRRVDS